MTQEITKSGVNKKQKKDIKIWLFCKGKVILKTNLLGIIQEHKKLSQDNSNPITSP